METRRPLRFSSRVGSGLPYTVRTDVFSCGFLLGIKSIINHNPHSLSCAPSILPYMVLLDLSLKKRPAAVDDPDAVSHRPHGVTAPHEFPTLLRAKVREHLRTPNTNNATDQEPIT